MSEIFPNHNPTALSSYVKAAWAGIDLEEYDQLISRGISSVTILGTYEAEGSLKSIHDSISEAAGVIPRRMLREIGADYDKSSKHTPKKLLKLAGVTLGERREVVSDPTIAPYFYRSARRTGSTHEECMEAHRTGISLKNYSVLIQRGFSHEDVMHSTLQLLSREAEFREL